MFNFNKSCIVYYSLVVVVHDDDNDDAVQCLFSHVTAQMKQLVVTMTKFNYNDVTRVLMYWRSKIRWVKGHTGQVKEVIAFISRFYNHLETGYYCDNI